MLLNTFFFSALLLATGLASAGWLSQNADLPIVPIRNHQHHHFLVRRGKGRAKTPRKSPKLPSPEVQGGRADKDVQKGRGAVAPTQLDHPMPQVSKSQRTSPHVSDHSMRSPPKSRTSSPMSLDYGPLSRSRHSSPTMPKAMSIDQSRGGKSEISAERKGSGPMSIVQQSDRKQGSSRTSSLMSIDQKKESMSNAMSIDQPLVQGGSQSSSRVSSPERKLGPLQSINRSGLQGFSRSSSLAASPDRKPLSTLTPGRIDRLGIPPLLDHPGLQGFSRASSLAGSPERKPLNPLSNLNFGKTDRIPTVSDLPALEEATQGLPPKSQSKKMIMNKPPAVPKTSKSPPPLPETASQELPSDGTRSRVKRRKGGDTSPAIPSAPMVGLDEQPRVMSFKRKSPEEEGGTTEQRKSPDSTSGPLMGSRSGKLGSPPPAAQPLVLPEPSPGPATGLRRSPRSKSKNLDKIVGDDSSPKKSD